MAAPLITTFVKKIPLFLANYSGNLTRTAPRFQCAQARQNLAARIPACSCLFNRPLCTQGAVTNLKQEEEPDILYKQLEIEVKGHDRAVLNSYEIFVTQAAKELELNLTNVWSPPRKVYRRTLLKSVHIYKKHRVQYQILTYFKAFELKHMTGSTADTFLEYIQRNLPEGTAMKVTKHKLEEIPDHIKPPQEQTT